MPARNGESLEQPLAEVSEIRKFVASLDLPLAEQERVYSAIHSAYKDGVHDGYLAAMEKKS